MDVAADRPYRPAIGDATPFKLDTLLGNTPADAPWGDIRSRTPVYRSPCGIAQCLALNPAYKAQVEYGTYKQLTPNNRIGTVGQRSRVLDVNRCHLKDLTIVRMICPKVNQRA